MSSIERRSIKLPDGFDPDKHLRPMMAKITKEYGSGWEIDSINMATRTASISRQAAITEVTESMAGNSFEVRLKAGTKPSDGDRAAAKFEDQYPGTYMTKFEPFLGKATLSELSDDEARCRGAVAVALGVKPWDVQVRSMPDGGYSLELPRTYVGSKHDSKLEEVATTVVGRDGWYVDVNAQKLTARFVPSEPPTFPEGIAFPLKRLGKGNIDVTPFGMILPEPGQDKGPEIRLDWTASAWCLVAGTPGPQPLDTRIPVPVSAKFPTGWARFGDLAVGDEVFTARGATTTVVELHPIRRQATHTLHFSDGQRVECGDNHLWQVSSDLSRKAHGPRAIARNGGVASKSAQPLEKAVQTKDLLASLRRGDGGHNWAVRVPDAVDLPDADLPIDPYLLGAWLGDGTSRNGGITVGAQDLDETRELLEKIRPVTRVETKTGSDAVALHFGRLGTTDDECVRGHNDWTTFATGRYCGTCRTEGGERTNESLHELLRAHGLIQNKHVPAMYARASKAQRLALLQGLMDSDGTVSTAGACELTLVDERLAHDAVDLIRSLGIKVSMRTSPSAITETDENGEKSRRTVGVRHLVHFTTSEPVFRLRRKAERLPASTRATQRWLYIEDITVGAETDMRCITVEDDEHLYLTDGFVPTHNSGKSVTLNALIADALSNGSELVVVDDVSKAVDFEWCKPFCRPGGWGCDSIEAGVAALGLVRQEGKRRAQVLKKLGINNWLDMPAGKRFTPILVIVDEVSALVVPDPIPKGVPKDHPLYVEIAERNLARAMLQSFMRKIVAELRFVGVRMVLSTQATNANTGVDPAMRTLIGHKILQGVNPSKAARMQIFSDESAVPYVPENVKAGGMRAKGVGVSTLEGQAPLIYKSYFASTGAYREALLTLGVTEHTERQVTPTAAQIDEFLPSLDDGKADRDSGVGNAGGGERAPSGRSAAEVAAAMGDRVGVAMHDGSLGTGYERANNMRHLAGANAGKATKKQKAESAEEAAYAARSGEVVVKQAATPPAPSANPEEGDDW